VATPTELLRGCGARNLHRALNDGLSQLAIRGVLYRGWVLARCARRAKRGICGMDGGAL